MRLPAGFVRDGAKRTRANEKNGAVVLVLRLDQDVENEGDEKKASERD